MVISSSTDVLDVFDSVQDESDVVVVDAIDVSNKLPKDDDSICLFDFFFDFTL
jgi:hypothetical protein